MTDETAEAVSRACSDNIRPNRLGFEFDVGEPTHFEKVVDRIRRCPFPGKGHVDETDLRVTTALCILGPGSSWTAGGRCVMSAPRFPPRRIRHHLLARLKRTGGSRVNDRAMEYAVAYACGKWRVTEAGPESWNTEWQGGIHAVARAILPAVTECCGWLDRKAQVRNHPDRDDSLIWQEAYSLATTMVFPTNPEGPQHLSPGDRMVVRCDAAAEVWLTGSSYKQDFVIESLPGSRTVPPGSRIVLDIPESGARLVGPTTGVDMPAGAVITVNSQDFAAWVTARWRDAREWFLSAGDTLSVRPGAEGSWSKNGAKAEPLKMPAKSIIDVSGGAAECSVTHNGHGQLMKLNDGECCAISVANRSAVCKCVPTPGSDPRWSATVPVGAEITVRGLQGSVKVAAAAPVERGVRLVAGQTAEMAGPFKVAIRECTCGTAECAARHRLSSWVAAAVSLWAFVASAVKGPSLSIKMGSFVQGMYYALLSSEGYAL